MTEISEMDDEYGVFVKPDTLRTIDLDCPPGLPRPGDLIDGVLEGTGLVAKETVSRFFGNWTWDFSDQVEPITWVERIQPIIKPRIEKLYRDGVIRYGSW